MPYKAFRKRRDKQILLLYSRPLLIGLAAVAHVNLVVHDQHLFLRQEQVPIVVAKVINVTLLGSELVGDISEVEASEFENLPPDRGFPLRTRLVQDVPVLAK